MITDITQNNLILMAYNELPPEKRATLEVLIDTNNEVKEEYNRIQDSIKTLNSFSSRPKETTVQIILEESSSSSLETI